MKLRINAGNNLISIFLYNFHLNIYFFFCHNLTSDNVNRVEIFQIAVYNSINTPDIISQKKTSESVRKKNEERHVSESPAAVSLSLSRHLYIYLTKVHTYLYRQTLSVEKKNQKKERKKKKSLIYKADVVVELRLY